MIQPGPAKRSAEDTLAIQAVVVLYGFLVDDREWDRFDQVFTEDAVVDFRDHSAEPPRGLAPIVGRAEIVRQFRDVLTHPYQHMLVNQALQLRPARPLGHGAGQDLAITGRAVLLGGMTPDAPARAGGVALLDGAVT